MRSSNIACTGGVCGVNSLETLIHLLIEAKTAKYVVHNISLLIRLRGKKKLLLTL